MVSLVDPGVVLAEKYSGVIGNPAFNQCGNFGENRQMCRRFQQLEGNR